MLESIISYADAPLKTMTTTTTTASTSSTLQFTTPLPSSSISCLKPSQTCDTDNCLTGINQQSKTEFFWKPPASGQMELVTDDDEDKEDDSDEEEAGGWLASSGLGLSLGPTWPSDLLSGKSGGISNWVLSLYRHLRARSLHLAEASQGGVLLTVAIPRYNRIGRQNSLWKTCELYIPNGSSSTTLAHLGDDPINGDRIFVGAIPLTRSAPSFYLKDPESNDEDHPNNLREGWYHLPMCHPLNKSTGCRAFWEVTLRDGELIETDRFWDLGITLFVKSSGSLKTTNNAISWNHPGETWSPHSLDSVFECSNPSSSNTNTAVHQSTLSPLLLHYFDEIVGVWRTRPLVPHPEADAYFVCLLELRSLTFVIYNTHTKTWIKSSKGEDFRIPFPGAFVVYPTGELFKCSATLGPSTAPPPELLGLVTSSTATTTNCSSVNGQSESHRNCPPCLLSGIRPNKGDWEPHSTTLNANTTNTITTVATASNDDTIINNNASTTISPQLYEMGTPMRNPLF